MLSFLNSLIKLVSNVFDSLGSAFINGVQFFISLFITIPNFLFDIFKDLPSFIQIGISGALGFILLVIFLKLLALLKLS